MGIRSRSGATLIGAVVAVWACGGTTTTVTGTPSQTQPLADSSFAAAITGAFTDSLTGPAIFQQIQTKAGVDTVLALSFGLGTQTGALVFVRDTSGPPYFGVDSLVPDTATTVPPAVLFRVAGVLGPSCTGCTPTGTISALQGAIQITTVSESRLRGTFSFVGTEVPADSLAVHNTIAVKGAFIAAAAAPVIDTATGANAGPCAILCDRVVPLVPRAIVVDERSRARPRSH